MGIIDEIRKRLCRALGCCPPVPTKPTIVGVEFDMALVKVGTAPIVGRVTVKYTDATGEHEGLPPGFQLQVGSDAPEIANLEALNEADPFEVTASFEADEIPDGVVDSAALTLRVVDAAGNVVKAKDIAITMVSDPKIGDIEVSLPGITDQG